MVSLGIAWVYSFNVFDGLFKQRARRIFLLIAMLIVSVSAFVDGHLPMQRVAVFIGILILGLAYSFPVSVKGRTIRIKDITFAKNLCIGLGWGAVVLLVGSGGFTMALWAVFVFITAQVMVGSAVRDVYDEETDRRSGIQSIVVRYGSQKCKRWFHAWNIATTLIAWSIYPDPGLGVAFIIAAFLRALVIHFADGTNFFWTQPMNILGTTVLFLTIYLTTL
jgi:4-hydroxybenzoate polyprenyltransferase